MRTAADFVPDATSGNSTSVEIAATPAVVWNAIQTMTIRELRITSLLMSTRSLPARLRGGGALSRSKSARARPLISQMTRDRFLVLAEEPERLLTLGVVGQFWKLNGGRDAGVRDVDGFVEFDEPGYVKSAIDFALETTASGTRLTTMTQNMTTDADSGRRFGRYWRVVGPGSKAIRLDMLLGIRRIAES